MTEVVDGYLYLILDKDIKLLEHFVMFRTCDTVSWQMN